MTLDWNAGTYETLPLPHVGWGRRTIDRMGLTGSEHVLDAGCGTGRDLALLLDGYPHVSAVGVDASASMLEKAAEKLAPYGERVRLFQADLAKPIVLDPPADAVMSVAAFHWVMDHDALFANLAAVMGPGAKLTSDCGGFGNIASVDEGVFRVTGHQFQTKNFADAETTTHRLEAAGFDVISVVLRPDPLFLDEPEVRSDYLATICLKDELAGVPQSERQAFTDAVRDAMPTPGIDYVRLEIDAIRR